MKTTYCVPGRTLFLSALSIFIFLASAQAQKESNIWYFGGRAGIDFNGPTPVPILNGAMHQIAGSATISDKNGDLLFYTNGVTVYNKNHVPMENGTGLKGSEYATQSVIIVPRPQSSTIYYVVTVDETTNNFNKSSSNGLNYSVVDLSANDGTGKVTLKNVPLLANMEERLTCVRHRNNTDAWIITYDYKTSTFYAFLVNARGIKAAPVVSRTGPIAGAVVPYPPGSTGYLKASPDGSKLAMAMNNAPYSIPLFSFDNATGNVSNPTILNTSADPLVAGYYGIEFSPNSSLLYVGQPSAGVYQFDLLAGGADEISQTRVQVAGTDFSSYDPFQALQLGPDNKIYIARFRSPHVSVIHHPNRAGAACTYDARNIFLIERSCYAGLPPLIYTFSSYDDKPAYQYRNTCFGEATAFSVPDPTGIDSIRWNFDDPTAGNANTAVGFNSSHTFKRPGLHRVKLTKYRAGAAEEIGINVFISSSAEITLGEDTFLRGATELKLNIASPNATYLWQDGSKGASYTVKEPGLYWVEVTNPCGTKRDSIQVAFAPSSILGNDTTLCAGEQLRLNAQYPQAAYKWSNGSTDSSLLVETPGTYWVEVKTKSRVFRDSVKVAFVDLAAIRIGNDTTLCDGEELMIQLPSAGRYEWSDGSTKPFLNINASGTYWVKASMGLCSTMHTIRVIFTNCSVFIPNVISPNNDGYNDTFVIGNMTGSNWELMIFDKGGKKVYQTTDYRNDWNAQDLSGEVYYYYLKHPGGQKTYKGWIHILR